MFQDNSLMPKEAVRLAALGTLAQRETSYAQLANEIRRLTSRFWGPTLEVMATSIELLRFEGLMEVVDENDDPSLCITDNGMEALRDLLRANIRVPLNDFNKLVLALKLRFLHVLPVEEQRDQADSMVELRQSELVRLLDLRQQQDSDCLFDAWLDHDITQVECDLAWFEALRDKIGTIQSSPTFGQ